MMNEICSNCGRVESDHKKSHRGCIVFDPTASKFTPSGRVSVPVAFVEGVREAVGDSRGFVGTTDKLRSMLAEIEGKEGGR